MKYRSFDEQLRLDAETYTKRAQAYIEKKEIDKAIGCLNKAIRKIKRADMIKLSPLEEAIFGPLMNEISKMVVKNIMEGQK